MTSTPTQTWVFDQFGRLRTSPTLTAEERTALWLARVRGTATDED